MSSQKIMPTAERWLSIDLLRALSIIFMIQNHFLYFLSPWHTFEPTFWLEHLWQWWVKGDLWAAQMFLFLSGFSVYLWSVKNRSMSVSKQKWFLIKRGLMLCLVGVFMSYLVENFVLNDVLLVIGLGAIVLAFLLNRSSWIGLSFVLFMVCITPFLQAWSQFFLLPFDSVDWPSRHLELTGWAYYQDLLINYWVRGYQPIIPWITFPLLGFVWAKMVHQKSLKTLTFKSLLIGGGALLLGSIFSFMPAVYVQTFSLYPLTTATLFFSFGVLILSLYAAFLVLDYFKLCTAKAVTSLVRLYSRFSLTIYVFHLTFLVLLMAALSWQSNQIPWFYYGHLLAVYQAIFVIGVFMTLLYLGLWFWDRFYQGRYSLEWWLRRFS